MASMSCTVTILPIDVIGFIASWEGRGRGVVLNDSGNYMYQLR